MFSGSNPGTDLYWSNALAQAQSQNNSLDWALLAQQWISHQQNINSNFEPKNCINPNLEVSDASRITKIAIKNHEEQGEADMDVEDDQQEPENQTFVVPPPPQMWPIGASAATEIPAPIQQCPASVNATSWGVWNVPAIINTNLPPPSLHIPDINCALDKINKPVIPSLMDTPINAPIDSQFPALDAAKRKTLPAWIREGLEKMEREKQKQMEREKYSESDKDCEKYDNKEFTDNLQSLDKSDILGSNRTKINSSNYKGFLKNSAASSDESEKTESEPEIEKPAAKKDTVKSWHGKTSEEIEEEMMLVVRRSLTEILLEITNEVIRNIAQETLKKHKLKASSAQVIRKSALTSISGNLGLGAYDSDSSNNSDTEDDENKKEDKDSEDEIREAMLNRQRSFKNITREIEAMLEKEAARQENLRQENLRRIQLERSSERLLSQGGENASDIHNSSEHHHMSSKSINSGKLIDGDGNGGNSRRSNFERDFGETHHDKKSYSSNGQKRLKERTSRFSDYKDLKNKTHSHSSAAAYALPTSTSNPLHSNAITTNSKSVLDQSPRLSVATDMLSNPAAAQNFLMANAVLSEALQKNYKKSSSSHSTSTKRDDNRRRKHKRRSRSRSQSSDSSASSSNASDNKSNNSSRTTSTSSSNSSKSKSSKSIRSRSSKYKSKDENKEKSHKKSSVCPVDDNRLDSVEYNHGRSHYHKSSSRRRSPSPDDDDRSSNRDDERSSSRSHRKSNGSKRSSKKSDYGKKREDDEESRRSKQHRRRGRRRHDNSPDSDDYYRSNTKSSRSSTHRNNKKDFYTSTSVDNRKRLYSRRDNAKSRSRSRSNSHSSKDKHLTNTNREPR